MKYILAWVHEWRLSREWCMLMADMFTAAAAISLAKVSWYGVAVLPPVLCDPVGIFRGGDMVGGKTPGIVVISNG